jgi:hypothetical protein
VSKCHIVFYDVEVSGFYILYLSYLYGCGSAFDRGQGQGQGPSPDFLPLPTLHIWSLLSQRSETTNAADHGRAGEDSWLLITNQKPCSTHTGPGLDMHIRGRLAAGRTNAAGGMARGRVESDEIICPIGCGESARGHRARPRSHEMNGDECVPSPNGNRGG